MNASGLIEAQEDGVQIVKPNDGTSSNSNVASNSSGGDNFY